MTVAILLDENGEHAVGFAFVRFRVNCADDPEGGFSIQLKQNNYENITSHNARN